MHFLFDGYLSVGDRKKYLQGVTFSLLSIGGFENLASSTVGDDIWIQSHEGKRSDIWYRLGKPSAEYREYHDAFLWTADLAKHVIDYIHVRMISSSQVTLADFRYDFYQWLSKTYENGPQGLMAWLAKYRDHDFRRVVASHAIFLYSQAIQVDVTYRTCSLWGQIHPRDLSAIPERIERNNDRDKFYFCNSDSQAPKKRKTTTTPFVARCFQNLPWSRMLYPQPPQSTNDQMISEVPTVNEFHGGRNQSMDFAPLSRHCKVGDVITIAPDAKGSWTGNDTEWLAYVQGTEVKPEGQKLSLLWLYRPSDTACMKMDFIHKNEIFLSDHCNCGDPEIYSTDIMGKVNVTFYGQPEGQIGYFCRQLYIEAEASWVTLRSSHFECICRKPEPSKVFSRRETVLYNKGKSGRCVLEPGIVMGRDPDDQRRVLLRKLLRLGKDCGMTDVAMNELVYTEHLVSISVRRLERNCHVRFYTLEQRNGRKIPAPYNRNGIGDHFFITTYLRADGTVSQLPSQWPTDLQPGWDPSQQSLKAPLKALDIFCGGGNFGRGLEEGGAIECQWAVDYCSQAIHTYKANLETRSKTRLFRGSVNHYLSSALRGEHLDGLVARPGEVEVIVAGSPCQGFSLANPRKGNDEGLLNESMVASVLSFIDFYRPKYAILENVKGIAHGREAKNVLAAVLCCLVAMGYQLRTFVLDAWSFSSPQSRTRIFISCAAPGVTPIAEPPLTHGHPPFILGASLGRTANGLHTGVRYSVPTPFPFISAEEAVKDLPEATHSSCSIAYPSHRESRVLTVLKRNLLSCVPRYPAGSGFMAAYERGLMAKPQIDSYDWNNKVRAGKFSKAWSRVRRNRLFPTILTAVRPEDGVTGTSVHWDEHRLLTILEVRRAQGFLDHEVILGSLADQWKIVGNSVARPVAVALGIALRQAWLDEPNNTKETSRQMEFEYKVVQSIKFTTYAPGPTALTQEAMMAVAQNIELNDSYSSSHDNTNSLSTDTYTDSDRSSSSSQASFVTASAGDTSSLDLSEETTGFEQGMVAGQWDDSIVGN